MKSSFWIALILALVATGWILSGQLGDSSPPAQADDEQLVSIAADRPIPRVQVREQTVETFAPAIVVTGHTEASRQVTVKAKTSGTVVEVPVERGSRVAKGDVIARLAPEDRPARLAEARALLEQRRIEHDAAEALAKKNFRAQTSVAAAKALLDAAKAAVAAIEVDIAKTTIRAPFDGVLDQRPVETGDFLNVGDPVGTVVDLDPCLIVAQISEREVGKLRLGALATAELVTGETVEGRISYIAAVADPETRTFRVELEVANGELGIMEGVTAKLRVPLGTVRAHRVSRALLTLDDDGAIGLKAVDDDGTVRFHPARIVGDTSAWAWLVGPPDSFTLITVGQDFVRPGMRVEPVPEIVSPGAAE